MDSSSDQKGRCYKEVAVGHVRELLYDVLGQEVVPGVLRSDDVVGRQLLVWYVGIYPTVRKSSPMLWSRTEAEQPSHTWYIVVVA